MKQRPIVHLPFSIGAFAIGAVKPRLENLTVIGQHFFKRVGKNLVVFRRSVGRVVHVPWGKINPKFQPYSLQASDSSRNKSPCPFFQGLSRTVWVLYSLGQRQKPS